MRAFVGLPVPEAWIAPLVRAQGRVRGGRRVPVEDLHVTLAFLGEQPEARLEALAEALSGRALRAADLRAVGYGAFGAGTPRLLALDLAATDGLVALRDAVRGAAREALIELPRERFRPHVTLVRFPAGGGRPGGAALGGVMAELGAPGLPPARAGALTLWCSTLTPDGPIYDPLEAWPLS